MIGPSFGARAGLPMMTDPNVAVLVSLDGCIGTTGRLSMGTSPMYRVDAALWPIMHLYEPKT